MAPLSFLSLPLLAGVVSAVTLSVASSGGNATSGYQYGLMFEDISHSGDGGIAFQGGTTLNGWTAFGSASIALDNNTNPLSSALPTSVKVTAKADGVVGIKNSGWWGIDVKAANTYTGSFYSLGTYLGNFTASLVSDITNQTLASVTVASSSVANTWTQHTYELQPSVDAPNSNNSFLLSYEATSGDVLNFDLISLFPPTYKDTPNGNRLDLMEALAGLKAKYFRIPGGNNLEGEAAGLQWNWTKTLGDLTERPGRYGDWGYQNTDGLGLIEYLIWCQDLELEPVLAVFAGYWLDETAAPEDELQPYVDSALAELEFLMDDSSTTWGAKRIALGYPDPFPIKFVEVGNEDGLSTTGIDTYSSYRLEMFYNAITAKYPDILIFSSIPIGVWPYWIGSVAEAIFAIGCERNADRVWGISYAPVLQNLNSYEWSPDLISFTADPGQTVLSTSYEVLRLLGSNVFTSTLPVYSKDAFGPAYWVAGVDDATSTYYLKAAVYNATEDVDFTVSFLGLTGGSATLTVLTAPDGYSHNAIGTEVVTTTTTTLTASGNGTFSFSLPELSVAVLAATA
ncbi:hypothetical protein VMCG_01633 [Cytospora schulzeri]|uniref:non-reducing end alpha-L-arabinofuranosidase n=1 Tax=Cytospora schulzeri TaxID=448051 RepID=A0A423X2Q6_9PEZI|nr:hypothetical protein VMCG_01633 [Valsa malicola]